MRKAMGFRGWTFGWFLGASASAGCLLAACDDDNDDGAVTPAVIEVAGTWESDFGDESITSTAWSGAAPQIVVSFDNAANIAITQNPSDATFAPNTFSRIVWTEPTQNEFYYCTTTYGQATAEAASSAVEYGIDRADVGAKGCGGFPWSHLTKK